MRKLTDGWKWNVGCLTLALTLVFIVGWTRSHFRRDVVAFDFGSGLYAAVSVASGLKFVRITSTEEQAYDWWPLSLGFDSHESYFPFKADYESIELHPEKDEGRWDNGGKKVEWLYEFGDFHFGSIAYFEQRDQIFMFPYWFFVAPLFLLSTYLLLSGPRDANSKILDLVRKLIRWAEVSH